MYFDDRDRFLETSRTATNLNRLNLRHEAMIAGNADLLAGADVLDIASHDGRWSLAALDAGARSVVGVEGRPELVAHAEETLGHYRPAAAGYRFVCSDVIEYLADPERFDVVLCLGFLYHTLRYPELLAGIRATGARHVVLDTRTVRRPRPVIELEVDKPEYQGMAIEDRVSGANGVLTGVPSHQAVEEMFRVYGYRVHRRTDWKELVAGRSDEGVKEYPQGRRITWTLERDDAA